VQRRASKSLPPRSATFRPAEAGSGDRSLPLSPPVVPFLMQRHVSAFDRAPRNATWADLRARSGLSTEQLIYRGRAEGWLVVPSLESV
jgi:hypothetical protein